jgi:ABC-2 type transport system permease protein
MLKQIIKNEWRNLRADKTLWLVAALFAASVGYAMFNGLAWTNFQRQTIAEAQAEERDRYDALKKQIAEYEQNAPEKLSRFSDPRDPAAAGRNVGQRYAAMPPAPLASLSIGQSDLLPYYFKISTRSQQTFTSIDELENPTNLLAGRFDTAFVIVYLLPLVILALSYNFLSGEREGGTLLMLLAQPISLRNVVLGKIVLRFSVVVVLALGFPSLFFLLGGGNFTVEGAPVGAGLWAAAIVAYVAFWFALAVAVNVFNWKSATNAVALAAVWLFFVILIPSLVGILVTSVYPVPSRVEMIGSMRALSSEASAQGSKILAKYTEDHPELVQGEYDPNDAAARTYAVQETVDRRIQPVLALYDEQLEKQQNLANNLRFLSPAIIIQEALNDVSGTSSRRYKYFLAQVKNFHAEWQNYFIPRVFQKAKITAATYDAAPQFAWREESSGAVASRIFYGLLGIVAFALAIAAFGLSAIRRYSPIASG